MFNWIMNTNLCKYVKYMIYPESSGNKKRIQVPKYAATYSYFISYLAQMWYNDFISKSITNNIHYIRTERNSSKIEII